MGEDLSVPRKPDGGALEDSAATATLWAALSTFPDFTVTYHDQRGPAPRPAPRPEGSKPETSPELIAGARGAGRGFLWKRNCPVGGSSPAEQGPGHSRKRPSNLLSTTLLQHPSQEGVLGRPWVTRGRKQQQVELVAVAGGSIW